METAIATHDDDREDDEGYCCNPNSATPAGTWKKKQEQHDTQPGDRETLADQRDCQTQRV